MIQSYLVETIVYAHESQKSERFKYIRRRVHTHVFCLMQEQKVSAFIVNWNPDVHVDFWPPYWCTTVEHQHGGSIQNFIKLHEALRQISQKRFTAQTWELERCSINVSSTTFQVFGLFHWTVSILLFCCGTVKTISENDLFTMIFELIWVRIALIRVRILFYSYLNFFKAL